MKSFQNKNAITLVELLITIMISAVIMIIVSFFISSSIEEITKTSIKTDSINNFFSFKDKLNRAIAWWYDDFNLYWTWTENTVIVLKNEEQTDWFLFWIVNSDTNKIQKEYIYWENIIWYRVLSKTELNDIQTNSWIIYDYTFFEDKLFYNLRIKDFKWQLYNWNSILDLYISIVLRIDDYMFWDDLSSIYFDELDIVEMNLVF